jgi:hypothetical protein
MANLRRSTDDMGSFSVAGADSAATEVSDAPVSKDGSFRGWSSAVWSSDRPVDFGNVTDRGATCEGFDVGEESVNSSYFDESWSVSMISIKGIPMGPSWRRSFVNLPKCLENSNASSQQASKVGKESEGSSAIVGRPFTLSVT